jgi:hypothetical protein
MPPPCTYLHTRPIHIDWHRPWHSTLAKEAAPWI